MKVFQAMMASLVLACPQAPEGKKRPNGEDMHRFLMFAVFEGLWEDGADPVLLRELRKNPFEFFIPKCSICDAVRQGFDVYLASPKSALSQDCKGPGLPPAIAADLKSATREGKIEGIRKLVERCVTRRFDRLKMSAEEKSVMEEFLAEAMKQGLSAKEDSFGATCPSCMGATRGKPKK